jgi:MG2 domain
MKYKNWILTGCLFLFAFIPTDSIDSQIIQALNRFSQQYPQEKVYLQLDKDYYASGETIWFKAYVTLQNVPTTLSTNLYVELMDKQGNILKRDILPIQNGYANGSFVLSRDFKQGNYRIRAYTAWMLNFDQAFLFYKDISVFQPQLANSAETDELLKKDSSISGGNFSPAHYAVQFFPEGGDLVEGLSSIVAFKAINDTGLPIDVQGKIVDNMGATITPITSVHDGMGSFVLTPQPGKTYQAVFEQDNGVIKSFALPPAKASGIVLHVMAVTNKARMYFSITRSEKDKKKYNSLILVGQMADVPVFLTRINFDEGLSGGIIPLDKLPSGIMQITVMDTLGVPLAERLAFVEKHDNLEMNFNALQLKLSPRGKNIFQLTTPDANNGNFSISVTDADQVKSFPYENNILSDLLLTSDIKGYVYHPGWYFRNDSLSTQSDLDLVMMTNGWRRFSWKKIMDDDYPPIHFPAENGGLVIKGQAMTMNGGKITMLLKDKADSTTTLYTAPVNNLGEFMISGLDFHDTAQVFLQGSAGQSNFVSQNIHVSGSFTDNLVNAPLLDSLHPPIITDENQLLHFLNITQERNKVNQMLYNRTILLKEVTVTAQRETPQEKLDKEYTSGMFSGGDAITFDLTKENIPYTSIFQYLQGRVAGLTITGDLTNPSISWRGGAPALYLNEMPVDVQTLSTLAVTDIAYIKVFRPPFMGGFNGGNGAIAIYTKKGGENSSSIQGLARDEKVGYTLVKQFYSPDYSVSNPNNDLPDERTTLYWNPNVIPDTATHTATVSFYNNDLTTRFHVVIEGMDADGRIGRIDTVLDGE